MLREVGLPTNIKKEETRTNLCECEGNQMARVAEGLGRYVAARHKVPKSRPSDTIFPLFADQEFLHTHF